MVAELSGPTGLPDHIDVDHPDRDLDGDGVADTVVAGSGSPLGGVLHDVLGDGSMAMVSDFDGDGRADHITAFDEDGGYSSWQLTSGDAASWTLTDRGSL